jgi:4-diphosphocytidyl-2-C-methyl-D-erythritol kinase
VTTSVAVRAQAKLNLWLHILAREDNGYHTIETLFHRIELADDVVVTLAEPGVREIACSEDVGPAHENLAYRAAQMYTGRQDWPTGFRIEITKRIPAGGGLGGGSADAAATLLGFNAIAPHACTEAELADMGAELGADVPFLVSTAARALAWGRGDRILELPALPQRHVALVIPSFGISTAEAYSSLSANERRPSHLRMDDLADWKAITHLARNDLSRSLLAARYPLLREVVATLRAAGATIAEMTGSGSVLFGIFDSQPDAAALERATGCRVVLTKTALTVEPPRALD